MIQNKLFYLNIEYDGKNDDYYFKHVQEGYKYLPDRIIYNGINIHNTLSDETLDKLVELENGMEKNLTK